MTIQEVAKQVWDAMGASNAQGLARSWVDRWMPVIRKDCEARGLAFNEHPINVIMIDKLAQLAGIYCDNTTGAYRVVHAMAHDEVL